MNLNNRWCFVLILFIPPFIAITRVAEAAAPAVANVLDRNSGAIIDSTFVSGSNWESSFFGLTQNSGTEFFESDNGNFNSDFVGERLSKLLGGVIANEIYDVSFYIAANDLGGQNMNAVEFSDFSSLAIGGSGGLMQWISTPTPVPNGGWVKWSGRYTPAAGDIGQQFQFRMIVDIERRHSLALDGPMTAQIIPEPAGIVSMLSVFVSMLVTGYRRSRTSGLCNSAAGPFF